MSTPNFAATIDAMTVRPGPVPDHVPVLIAVCQGDSTRYASFDEYLGQLDKPAGTRVTRIRGSSIAKGRNMAVQTALDIDADWLMFLDDDHVFGPDLLTRLLDSAGDRDLVSATYLNRRWPFHVNAYWNWVTANDGGPPGVAPVSLVDGKHGLTPIVACGMGACLISTRLLRRLPHPWFTLTYRDADVIAEDIAFFSRVAELSEPFPRLYLDLDAVVGHQATLPVWPFRDEDGWMTMIMSGTAPIPIPAAAELVKMDRKSEQPPLPLADDPAARLVRGVR